LIPWLQELQVQTAERARYEYMPLLQTRAWSGVPGDLPLLEILFLFQNFPMDAVAGQRHANSGFLATASSSAGNSPAIH